LIIYQPKICHVKKIYGRFKPQPQLFAIVLTPSQFDPGRPKAINKLSANGAEFNFMINFIGKKKSKGIM
jgi:hypothetical protein